MKDYRNKEQKYLLIIYMLLLIYWCTDLMDIINTSINSASQIFSIIEGGIVSGIISLFVFISDSLFSSDLKDRLVGLFFIPRSGNTVFSRIKDGKINDDRFTLDEAKKKYIDIIKQLPKETKKRHRFENSSWYKIYCKYQKRGSIKQAERDYLLCRDLFVETILFIFLYIFSIFIFNGIIKFSLDFLVIIIIIATITNIATHIKMDRFVNNVIAIDVTNINKQD